MLLLQLFYIVLQYFIVIIYKCAQLTECDGLIASSQMRYRRYVKLIRMATANPINGPAYMQKNGHLR